jgi:SAM-dependent methyltransferase
MPKSLDQEIIALATACLPLRRHGDRRVVEFARLYGWDVCNREHQVWLAALALLNSALRKSHSPGSPHLLSTPLDALEIEAPDPLALSIAEAARDHLSADINFIGELYARIIPQAERRLPGQFWTASLIAEWMVAWLLQSTPRAMLDIGCGPGNFLLKAAQILDESGSTADLYGLDLSPILLNITRSAFLTRHGENSRLMPELIARDYLNDPIAIEADAVVCNPPYTRHHHIDSDLKERMKCFVKERLQIEVSRQATLACHFLLKLIAEMEEGARAAVIVPMETLDARYGIAAKLALRNHTSIAALIRFAPHMNAFHKVDVGACILLFEKGRRTGNRFRRLTLEDLPSTGDLLSGLKRNSEHTSFGSIYAGSQDELKEDDKWLTSGSSVSSRAIFLDNGPVAPLKSLARIVRGIATGANDFFVLSSESVERYSLARFVVPTLHRNREVRGLILDREGWKALSDEGRRVWLLYLNGDYSDPDVLDYIARGEALGYHLRSLVRTRRKWYSMERREVPAIFFTLLTRGNPRFILNRAGVRPINMFLLIYPDRRIIDGGAVELLWVLLNSRFSISRLHSISRTYGGNTLKVEPREMDNLPVIDPLRLPGEIRRQLTALISDYHRSRDARALLGRVDEILGRYIEA